MPLLLLLACVELPPKAGLEDTAPDTSAPDTAGEDTAGEDTDTDGGDSGGDDTAPDTDSGEDTDVVTTCCSDVIQVGVAGTWILADAPITAIAAVGDLTGDGVGDLEMVHMTRASGAGQNTLLVYAGGALPDTPWRGDPTEASYRMTGAPWALSLLDEGDVNGDGANDLGVIGVAYWGSIRHVPGALPAGGTSAWEDAEEVSAVAHNGLWGAAWAGVDLDGDGAADIAAGNDGHGDGYDVASEVYYSVYFGGDLAEPCDVRHRNDGAVSDAGPAGVLGDGDGDGLPELAFYAEGTWIVRGADVRDLCSAYVEDLAVGWRDAEFSGYYLGDPLGDWTGDGYGDFTTWAAGGQDTGEAGIWVLSAADVLAGPFGEADALGSWVAPVENTSVSGVRAADFDGDGIDDLLFSGFEETSVIRGGTVPAPFDALPTRRLRYDGSWWCGYLGDCADITGDGRADLLFWESDRDTETMNAWVVPGFDVPWDDAAAW